MYHDIIDFKHLDNFKLKLTFDDKKSGVLDCKYFINKGSVFARLSDPDTFNSVHINKDFGVLVWDGDIDIAPETVYHLATGSPLPDWMEK